MCFLFIKTFWGDEDYHIVVEVTSVMMLMVVMLIMIAMVAEMGMKWR